MTGAAPATASARRYLREGMPAIYREDDFAMRLLTGLEEVLDPIVALLDALHHHVDPRIAPLDMVELVAVWLGAETADAPTSQQREIVERAPELSRLRGTRAGLELVLRLNFPELSLTVFDLGGVTWSTEGDPPPATAPGFEVACATALTAEQHAALERVIRRSKPAHVVHRVVVRQSPRVWSGGR